MTMAQSLQSLLLTRNTRGDFNMSINILIVEDEFIIALDLQNRLKNLGYNANDIVSNVQDAIRVAQKTKPDLILMDILIAGDMDGIETATIINKDMDIPIIYVTAYSDRKILERAKLTNSYGYVNKPYNERELVSTIEIAMARAQVQKLLVANEAKFRRIFENAGDQLLVLDSERKIIEANTFNIQELGYTIDELKAMNFDQIFQSRKTYLNTVLKKISNSSKPMTFNGNMTRKDGTRFPCEIRVSVYDMVDNKQPLYLASARNMTERIEAKKVHQSMMMQLAHAGKLAMLGTISAGLIHELKNPLTSIIGFSDLILTKKGSINDIENKISTIQKAAMQMKHTIDHLNVYTRQDTVEDMLSTNLNTAISNALEIIKGQVEDIAVNIEYHPNLGTIWGNVSQLEAVLQNLIINSVDSFQDRDILEKTITIKTYEKNNRIFLEYEDNAGGIKREVLPRVFDPFYTTKKAGQGTGLGLSIIRSIMEHHKGFIDLNVKELRGSRFLLSFPKEADYAEAEFDSHKMITCKLQKQGKAHILLIDDDPQFTSILESVLSEKFDVMSFNDPEKAMAQIRADNVDLIVTDLDMPKVTGQDIIRFAHTLKKHIPIIVITGTSVNKKVTQLNNVEAVVEKPISEYENLIQAILKHLETKEV